MMESLQEKADRLRLNASPEERFAIAAHELGHYEMANRAGVQPEGITIGHHVMDSKSASVMFSSEGIDTGLTHSVEQWRQRGRLITDQKESQFFSLNYLKSLYAGEIAEEVITGKPNNSGVVDTRDARRWMTEHGLPDFVIYQTEAQLKSRATEELGDPETKRKLSYAAHQLAEHHFDGKKHPASTIEHYLNGGSRQNLPTEER